MSQFLVVGVDGPAFGSGDLLEAHWSYMDGFADRLVARGPTLSPDGEEHTGSVHVVELADLAAAEAFAHDEPFAQAGWYSSVTVEAVRPLLEGTMWDRPPAAPVSALVTARLTAPVTDLGQDVPWVYVGATDAGLVAMLDLAPAVAASVVRDLGGVDDVVAQRWERGGRR